MRNENGVAVKTGGRRAGSPNRPTQLLMEKAEKLGVDPFTILLHFAAGNWEELGYRSEKYIKSISELGIVEEFHITPETRVQAAKEACQYLYPKRKALELSTDPENPLQVHSVPQTIEETLELISKARGV